VEIRLVDGDPELAVVDDGADVPSPPSPPEADFDEARITIRLPGYLKDLVADAASTSGDSVNAYVIDTLKSKTQTTKSGATRHRATIEL
jgi:predicted HicB family RNase H-like nuclease